jgi:two-component system sensor histidine kinase HydH
MHFRNRQLKAALIIVLIGGTLCLHYFTQYNFASRHAVYRMLFYLPLVLGSFWFGFKGAIGVSIAVNFFYIPYVISNWQGFIDHVDRLLEGVLYVFIALIVGYLAERERKEQAARRQAESLASIGRAVSEIAHDMKSPLMAIGGFTSQVSRKLSPDDPNRKKLDMVVDETARLESMVKEMLDFGRPLQLQPSMESLNNLASECIELGHSIAETHEVVIKMEFDPQLPLQPLDRNRIKQVIVNLITNAIQASSSGKIVWVRTRKGSKEAVLEVADCGCGIREEDQEKIFEPFFTTKKDGTGLGLPIVKKIVDAHGGNISLYSNPEGGITFNIRLPLGPWSGRETLT